MSRNRDCIFECFQFAQKQRIGSCDVPSLNQIWSLHSRFQVSYLQPALLLLLRTRQLWFCLSYVSVGLALFVLCFLFLLLCFFLFLRCVIVFFGSFNVFFKDCFEIIVIFACEYIRIFFNDIDNLDLSGLFLFLIFQLCAYLFSLFKKLFLMFLLTFSLLLPFLIECFELFRCEFGCFAHHSYKLNNAQIYIVNYWQCMKKSMLNIARAEVELSSMKVHGKIRNLGCFRWFRIFVFQFMATAILTYGIISSQYLPLTYPQNTNNQPMLNPTHSIFESMTLFVCLCFVGQLTDAHCNPAVTLSLLVCKGKNVSYLMAVIYIISQYLGAIVGGLFAWWLVPIFGFNEQAPIDQYNTQLLQWRILLGQISGTFMFCLFILIVTTETTSFLKSIYWNYLLIPIAFYISRETTYQLDSLNPATTFAFQLVTGIKFNNWVPLSQYYLYIVGPLLGAVMCASFFNFFFVPLLIRWKNKK